MPFVDLKIILSGFASQNLKVTERAMGHINANCLYNQHSHLFLQQWPEFSLIAT